MIATTMTARSSSKYHSARFEYQQVDVVRSDAGRFDWPVGMLCRTLRHALMMRDLGTGGYDGFRGGFLEQRCCGDKTMPWQ
jgi:hypothetical protein